MSDTSQKVLVGATHTLCAPLVFLAIPVAACALQPYVPSSDGFPAVLLRTAAHVLAVLGFIPYLLIVSKIGTALLAAVAFLLLLGWAEQKEPGPSVSVLFRDTPWFGNGCVMVPQ